jgi:ribonucleoside-diphosphate reductase alpha chain
MKINRQFTSPGSDPFASVTWVKRSSRITNPDGSIVFEMKDAEVPESWSQLATDIMVSKYFRKAGVPQWQTAAGDTAAPVMVGGKALDPALAPVIKDGKPAMGPERSAKQVIHRLAGCWRHWGETHNYFDTPADAQAFYDELCYMITHQMCAPNSPQWFNTGLQWAYGINGPAQGHWIADHATGALSLADDAYTHPQPHACFIQSVDDDLVNEGGIMDLWVREARLFKYGSGTGTNFSHLRGEGEKLSGGGRSSGLMSWLRIGDRAASAIKSGGTTRRAAKMVCLDMDHPDIGEFIDWKVREEIKVQAMVEGFKLLSKHNKDTAQLAQRLGLKLDYDYNGEAYATVSGQNSNNSVRIPDAFFETLDAKGVWETFNRTNGKVSRTFQAAELWERIGDAAWRCADPGVQYDTTINAWHTCPSGGRINASNPCSEYMFLDNTACNLASLNVLRFYDASKRTFDVKAYEHGIDLWTVVLEISVLMAAFPSRAIAELSWKYRTLGLGYANLGAMLMQAGIAYDSEQGRAVCGMLSAILTGRSYRMSAVMAGQLGAFAGYQADKESMLRVIRNHRRAAKGVSRTSAEWESLNAKTRPVPIDHALIKSGAIPLANSDAILTRAVAAWDDALSLGEKHGFRNAQVTVIAPTGTIGLLMDCDTTGVEPDFALVKFKKLAGGGYFKIANESVRPALVALGYTPEQIKAMMAYVLGTLTLDTPLPAGVKGGHPGETLAQFLRARGLSEGDIASINASLPGAFELSFAFAAWALSPDALKACGVDPAAAQADPNFNLLSHLGLTSANIDALNLTICGTSTVEGAPFLKAEHLPVFDCANKCGRLGKRFIHPKGHITMMAAAQPFISGAISKTINLPNDATIQDIKDCYRMSWELGLKANALYRDGCKLSQPLSATTDEAKKEAGQDDANAAKESAEGKSVPEQAPSGTHEAPLVEIKAGSPTAPRAVATAAASDAESLPMPHANAGANLSGSKPKPARRRLPDTRRSVTHRFNINGHEGYLTVGLYDDGQPGELFITMSKEGSTIGGLMDSLGTATSVALQYGVPLQSLVNKFSHQRFEPAGITENADIPFAKSLVDYIFRWLGMQFIPGYFEEHSPRAKRDEILPGGVDPAPGRLGAGVMSNDTPAPSGPRTAHAAATTRTPAASPSSSTGRGMAGSAAESLTTRVAVASDPMDEAMKQAQADSPACDVCGTLTVRSGICYKCLNCGNSMGCS